MASQAALDPNSPVPLYLQLKAILSRLIREGELQPHSRFASERELSEEFGISRMTVRQAVQALIREGQLYTRVGKGTYVGDIRLEQDRYLTGFSEQMHKLGLRPSSQVLEQGIFPADAHLAQMLEIQPESPVIRLIRLRFGNGETIARETAHLPQALAPNLLSHDFSGESLYAVLRQEYGLNIAVSEQTIAAGLATRSELQALNLKAPAAVLRMGRITRTDLGIVAEYTESVYRGDRYELRTTLHTPHEQTLQIEGED